MRSGLTEEIRRPSRLELFGHPAGLTILFLTEMWADFSYYGMRALLVYYMTRRLGFTIAAASTVYGLYTASAHLTPLAGGLLADRWLGKRNSVAAGATIMAAGHFMMGVPTLFYPALATIALGFGLFLPSLPGQVASLYLPGDARLDRAYSVYYVGINLGSFLAPLVCGTLGERFGWSIGFGAAGVGMLAGLVIYLAGMPLLPPSAPSGSQRGDRAKFAVRLRPLVRPLVAVALAVILFRIAYEQIGNSIALWAQAGVDRDIAVLGHFVVPMTWFQSLNPLFIFLFTPLILRWWVWQGNRHEEPAAIGKMSVGAALLAAAFVLIAIASATQGSGGGRASWTVLVLFMAVLTAGELFFMPIGLSLVTRLAPPEDRATLLGGWFILAFIANLLAGLLGRNFGAWPSEVFFVICAGTAFASAVLLWRMRRVDWSVGEGAW
jgi:POT family proton-dependent oligopeptide transporter